MKNKAVACQIAAALFFSSRLSKKNTPLSINVIFRLTFDFLTI